MKTVLWIDRNKQEFIINGHQIIIGFGEPVINPVETDEVVKVKIFDTRESKEFEVKHKAFNDKSIEVNGHMKAGGAAVRSRMIATKNKNTKEAEKQSAIEVKCVEDYKKAYAEAEVLQKELKAMKPVMQEVKKRLRRELAVYFEPKFGEKIIAEEELLSLLILIRDKGPDELVTVEGLVIKNPDHVAPEMEEVAG